MLALIDPGDEVIVFEPFYESYGPNTILCGAIPRYVQLHLPDWKFDEAELAAAFNDKTRAIILNFPAKSYRGCFYQRGIAEDRRTLSKVGRDRHYPMKFMNTSHTTTPFIIQSPTFLAWRI